MKEYDIYLFDSDGTMTDTAELIYQSYCSTARQLRKEEPTRDAVFATIGMPLRPQMEIFLGPLDDAKYDAYQKIYMDYQFQNYREHLVLFPGIKELLLKLKLLKKPLGVVTSRRIVSLKPFLEQLEIFDLFDVHVTPELTVEHKPAAEPVLYALERLGGSPDRALFIGDATYDIDAGIAAGVDTAFVTWSNIDVKGLPNAPTYVIDKAEELLW